MRQLKPVLPQPGADSLAQRNAQDIHDNFTELAAAVRLLARGEQPSQRGRLGGGGGVSVTDHGSLAGLTAVTSAGVTTDYNDDHTQYAHLPGRADGQTLFGSRLNINTSQWATRGTVLAHVAAPTVFTGGTLTFDDKVVIGRAAILVLNTYSNNNNYGGISGTTTDHTSLTDSVGNIWTKQVEYTSSQVGGAREDTVSVWTTIVTTAIVGGVGGTTITCVFGQTYDSVGITGRQFEVPSGSTSFVVTGTTQTATNVGATYGSLSITDAVGDALFVRAIGMGTHATGTAAFVPTSGWSEGDDDAESTNGTEGGPRMEFLADGGGSATSAPSETDAQYHANVLIAFTLDSGSQGELKFKSVDMSGAATVLLEGGTTHIGGAGNENDRLVIFEDSADTELSYIRASDGAFVGPMEADPKLKLLNTDLFDDVVAGAAARGDLIVGNSTPKWASLAIGAANSVLWTAGTDAAWTTSPTLAGSLTLGGDLLFTTDDASDIGTTTSSPQTIYGRGLSIGDKTTQTAHTAFRPTLLDFQSSQAGKTLDGLRIVVENTSNTASSKGRALFLSIAPHTTVDGEVLHIERDMSNVSSATLPAALTIEEVFGSAEITAATGASFILQSTGAARATDLIGLTLGATGASSTNKALYISSGDVDINSSDVYSVGFLGIAATAATVSSELARITNDGYGWLHDDGSGVELASFISAGSAFGALGMVSNHSLYFITHDTLRMEIESDGDVRVRKNFIIGNGVASTDYTLTFDGDAADGVLTWDEGNDWFDFSDAVLFDAPIAVGSTNPASTTLVSFDWYNQNSGSDEQETLFVQAEAGSDTEGSGNRVFSAVRFDCLQGSGTNIGRNFKWFVGVKGTARMSRAQSITWTAGGGPRFYGGQFVASWTAAGFVSPGPQFYGGEFTTSITANPSSSMTAAWNVGGYFSVNVTGGAGSKTNLNITRAIGSYVLVNTTAANSTTRAYGILIDGVSGGSTNWGVFSSEDICLASDKYLVLEGTSTAKGDTRLRWNSATSDMEFDINGTTEMTLDASGVDVVNDVRAEQLIADGDTGGTAATNTVTGATDTPTTDPGWATSSSVDMNAPDGYVKAYVGTQAVVIAYWNT